MVNYLQQCLHDYKADLKRHHLKYVDMRQFAYLQIEALVRQLNQQKKNIVQNSNINVLKQLAEKERKHLMDEVNTLQDKIKTLEQRVLEYAEEMEARENTDKLVQGHV